MQFALNLTLSHFHTHTNTHSITLSFHLLLTLQRLHSWKDRIAHFVGSCQFVEALHLALSFYKDQGVAVVGLPATVRGLWWNIWFPYFFPFVFGVLLNLFIYLFIYSPPPQKKKKSSHFLLDFFFPLMHVLKLCHVDTSQDADRRHRMVREELLDLLQAYADISIASL